MKQEKQKSDREVEEVKEMETEYWRIRGKLKPRKKGKEGERRSRRRRRKRRRGTSRRISLFHHELNSVS